MEWHRHTFLLSLSLSLNSVSVQKVRGLIHNIGFQREKERKKDRGENIELESRVFPSMHFLITTFGLCKYDMEKCMIEWLFLWKETTQIYLPGNLYEHFLIFSIAFLSEVIDRYQKSSFSFSFHISYYKNLFRISSGIHLISVSD